MMRSTSSSRPKCSAVPRPVRPSTPIPCASSTISARLELARRRRRAPAAARCRPPSRRRRPPRSSRPLAPTSFFIWRRRSLTSLWRNLQTSPNDSRAPSMMQAWSCLSRYTVSPLPTRQEMAPEVHLEPGGEDDRRVLPHELGQPLLEPHVKVQRAVQEAAARASGAVLSDRVDRRLLDPRIVGQSEIVVRAEHQQAPARRWKPRDPARIPRRGRTSRAPPGAHAPARHSDHICRRRGTTAPLPSWPPKQRACSFVLPPSEDPVSSGGS